VVKNQDYVLYLIPSQHSSFYFQLFLCNHPNVAEEKGSVEGTALLVCIPHIYSGVVY
jgi:hypothetical protein